MKKCDKGSQSIVLAGLALLVKMLITLEPDGMFGSNFIYLCIVTLSSHWYEKCDEASTSIILAGRALLVKMLIINSWTAWYNLFKFCILMYFEHCPATDMQMVTRLH